jgi:hypothetical protein
MLSRRPSAVGPLAGIRNHIGMERRHYGVRKLRPEGGTRLLDGENGSVSSDGLAQQGHASWMPAAGGVRTVLFHPSETGDVAIRPLHGVDETHVRHLAGYDGVPKSPFMSLAN